eukprot:8548674-Pyramimonas_sp.AAC.1
MHKAADSVLYKVRNAKLMTPRLSLFSEDLGIQDSMTYFASRCARPWMGFRLECLELRRLASPSRCLFT